MKKYYVYIDSMLDTEEIFYVGEGSKHRIKTFKRNPKYNQIVKKHGVSRKIWEVLSKESAVFLEMLLIKLYHTWTDDLNATQYASNFRSFSEAKKVDVISRLKMSISANKRRSKELYQQIAEKNRNQKRTKETCENISKSKLRNNLAKRLLSFYCENSLWNNDSIIYRYGKEVFRGQDYSYYNS